MLPRRLREPLMAGILTGALLLSGCGLDLSKQDNSPSVEGVSHLVPSPSTGGSSAQPSSQQQSQKSPPPFLTGGISWEEAKPLTVAERKQADTAKGTKTRQFYLDAGHLDIWFFHALPYETYSVTLVAWSGDPDLYVYYPERPCYFPGLGWIDWLFDITLNPLSTVSFTTGSNYPYWFGPYQVRYVVVYACTPCTYSLYVERL